MSDKPLVAMVDTNVWVDMYIPQRPRREEALAFFAAAERSDIELAFTLEIARAVFRIVSHEAKAWARSEKGELSESFAHAIAAHAWDFIDNMQLHATPVGSSPADMWLASKLRDTHTEIEDDLIIAACMRTKADYLITNDKKLIRHAPVKAVTPATMVKLLDAGVRG